MGTWSPEETGVTHICGLLAQSQQPGSDQSQVGAITSYTWPEGPACTTGNHLIICQADADLCPIEGCTISTSQRRPFSSITKGLMARCRHECCSHGCLGETRAFSTAQSTAASQPVRHAGKQTH